MVRLALAGGHCRGQRVRRAAAADDSGQTPGSAAALLLTDTHRLLGSALSTRTVEVLWLSASGRGYDIDQAGVDARDRLRLIRDVCEERLREVAHRYRHDPPPPRTDVRDVVLREMREAASLLTDVEISPRWKPVPGASALAAVEEVVTDVDADLGFRLFLRLLRVASPFITHEQYNCYQALGRRFGYGEHHVAETLEQLDITL
ncbi:hypothetical protein [Streptomyces sp. NPDC018610]|uniref:hypothetical protein n=1 Tax=Streptomyces sp. NPDC018610 TaxID=3365049 RepID=UPI0037BD1065